MILLLIGTSSTGKTTLAESLQALLPGYWQYMSLDLTLKGVPAEYAGGDKGRLADLGFAYSGEGLETSIKAGEWGHRVLSGMIDSAFEMDSNQVNVIFDDMLLDTQHAELWQAKLSQAEHLVVRLSASKEVLLKRIGPRSTPDGVTLNHIESNKLLNADIEIDTTKASTEEIAARVVAGIQDKKIHQLA